MSNKAIIPKALYKSKLYLKKHSPLMLTCVASAGVLATAVMAVRATPKALERIKDDSRKNHEGNPSAYTKTEAIISAWKCYIPAAAIGTSTIICIFGANALNRRQQASLASAYALMSNSYKEYKLKLKELYGEEAHRAIIDSIEREKCEDVHITAETFCCNSTLDFEEGRDPEVTRTFYDSFSQRYFESTISKVIQAEYHLNRNFLYHGVISLNEFYEFLGLEKTDIGKAVGWSRVDDLYWIDFDHHKTVLDSGMEVFYIDMVFEPTADWTEDI